MIPLADAFGTAALAVADRDGAVELDAELRRRAQHQQRVGAVADDERPVADRIPGDRLGLVIGDQRRHRARRAAVGGDERHLVLDQRLETTAVRATVLAEARASQMLCLYHDWRQ